MRKKFRPKVKQKQLLLLLALLITAATGAWAQTGMTKGSFSVSATKRVHFSKGNLQLVGENTFQFAENQWDVFGNTQSNGHRDLFGWGTANNPDLISENNNDYSTFTDWGTKIGDGTTWRTLTNDEWNYVLNTRTASTLNGTENARYAYATVNGVGGLILFPDNYTHPGTVAAPAQINTPSNAFNANTFSANTYNSDDWLAMEDAGAVFLPHGGCRTGTVYQSNQPNYWSSTPNSTDGRLAYGLNLSPMEFKNWFRFRGCSVRLVTDGYVVKLADGTQDAKNWTIASGQNSVKGDAADGLTGLNKKDAVTLTYNGRLKVKSVTATTDAEPAKEPATVTTAPTGAAIVGRLNTNSTALVSGGEADGGTLRYAVTTTNTKPTSTDGFSDAVPTAQTITASGKVYVWYYVKGDDTHSDSEIAATAIEVPVADIVWDATNVSSDLEIYSTYASYVKEGVTLSANADHIQARWDSNVNSETDGIFFFVGETGGFTFSAPTGKKFTKIEMKPIGPAGWYEANQEAKLGTGWAFDIDYENAILTVTWTGGAASTVDLLTGADRFNGHNVKYIAFYLSE